MIGYWCSPCRFMFRELELNKRKCPECGETCKPRLILGGQVMGATNEEARV